VAPVSNSTTVLIALYNCEITLTQITHFVYSGTILHIHIKYYVNNKSELKIISYSIIYKDKMTAEQNLCEIYIFTIYQGFGAEEASHFYY